MPLTRRQVRAYARENCLHVRDRGFWEQNCECAKNLKTSGFSKLAQSKASRPPVPMATVERNVYDERTMSVFVTGEPGTDEAETFLQDKLCEQGLKGAREGIVTVDED